MNSFLKKSLKLTIIFSSTIVLTGAFMSCDDTKNNNVTKSEQKTEKKKEKEVLKPTLSEAKVVETNAKIAFAVFSDSKKMAETLKVTIDAFVDDPTTAKMDAAKNAWKAAREPYGQSEVYRFGNKNVDDWEGKVNAWPLGEAMIDYVATKIDGNSGPDSKPPSVAKNILSDIKVDVTKPAIIGGLNENNDDERNVSSGYHAIEFMLWGQDLNNGGTAWDGIAKRDNTPGQRPVTDFSPKAKICTTGADHQKQSNPAICKRRGAYLKAVTQLLIDDLDTMVSDWDPSRKDNYYQSFVRGGKKSIGKMLAGMGRLSFGELAGERINIARLQNSQEDEQSCFSDNTHRDIVSNALGIQNTYLGSYTDSQGKVTKGPGIYDYLMSAGKKDLAEKLKANIEITMTAARVISEKAEAKNPFDNQIQSSDQSHIKKVISALINQATRDVGSVNNAAKVLGINIDNLEQDTEEKL